MSHKPFTTICLALLSSIGISSAIASKTSPKAPEPIIEAQATIDGSHGAKCKVSLSKLFCYTSVLEFDNQISSEQYKEISKYQSALRDDDYNQNLLDALKDSYISVNEYIELREIHFAFNKNKVKTEFENIKQQ